MKQQKSWIFLSDEEIENLLASLTKKKENSPIIKVWNEGRDIKMMPQKWEKLKRLLWAIICQYNGYPRSKHAPGI